ncbi:MAG TPA: N-acetylmuramoyl-L-alanine amidase [Gammaproteobacteria bacterium]|nr:N-acetylmuramoyl-L-alanine amidase [Gammaproteobacteria bacterium]
MMSKRPGHFFILILLIIFPAICHASTVRLNDVHVATSNNTLRITLSLSDATPSRIFALSNPPRMVVDLKNTRLATSLSHLDLKQANIRNIRIGYPARDVTRVVFDLKTPAQLTVVSGQNDNRVVIDVRLMNNVKKITHPLTSTFQPVTLSSIKRLVSHPVVIVIDPGHGGHDPGAMGSNGVKEKNVTLAISKRLASLINQQPGMRAVLTRHGDYYMGLRGRLQLARKENADLFIALHADSYFNNRASGASVYALSQHGATSEAARWLARRDNYSELGGVDLRELSDQSYLLRSVLIDLAQTATITDSLHLGNSMLSNLRDVTRLHYSRVEQAPFMVLKSPDIPSILVEMGFISNAREEQRLNDEDYQDKVALALFDGIRVYFKKYHTTGV